MARFALIANPAAGGGDSDRLETARRTLAAAGSVKMLRPEGEAQLDAALDEARDATLVVAGGDGSLHAVVQRLRSRGADALSSRPLGLVPLGTGNDFARGVGIPLDPADAAAALLEAAPRPMDLIIDETGAVVVNAAHAGLGAAAAEESERYKQALGPLAYPLGALIAGVRESGSRLRVEVDGEVAHDGDTLMVAVMNGPCVGGGTVLCAHARADDGLLDVVIAAGVGAAARIALGAGLRDGTHLELQDVSHLRGTQARIAGEPVRHDVDGEVSGAVASRSYQVEPGAWRLLASQGANASLLER